MWWRYANLFKQVTLFNPHRSPHTRFISQTGRQRRGEVTYWGSHSQQEVVPRFQPRRQQGSGNLEGIRCFLEKALRP